MIDLMNRISWLHENIKPFGKAIEDVIVSSIPQIVTILAGLVISALIARGLGPVGMGEYALILSIPTLIIGLSDLGIGQTAIRFASKAAFHDDENALFAILRWALRLRLLLITVIVIIFYFLAPIIATDIWHDEGLVNLIRLSLLIGIFTVISHIPSIYFQSLKRFRMNSLLLTMQTLVTLSGILIIAWLNLWSLQAVIVVSVIASIVNAILFMVSIPRTAFFVHKKGKLAINSLKKFWNAPQINIETESIDEFKIGSFAFYMFLSSLAVMITLQADIWLLGFFLDKSLVGIYNVEKYFSVPLLVLLGAVNTALWPRASALAHRHQSIGMLKTTFKFSALIAGVCIIYSILAPFTTPWIFGAAYSSGILIGIVLCIRYCISILTCPIGIIGYNFGLVKVYWWINLIQLAAVVGINIWLLPVIGPMGSAIALIVNEIIGFSIQGLFIWRRIKISD